MWLDVFTKMRKRSGMSIDEISAKSGVPKGTLSKISAGITKAPPLETMRKLVYAMGYTLDDLDENLSTKKSPSTAETEPGVEQDTLRSTLLYNFGQLNQEGRERLVETSDDMVLSGKYIKSDKNKLGEAKNA